MYSGFNILANSLIHVLLYAVKGNEVWWTRRTHITGHLPWPISKQSFPYKNEISLRH